MKILTPNGNIVFEARERQKLEELKDWATDNSIVRTDISRGLNKSKEGGVDSVKLSDLISKLDQIIKENNGI